LKKSASQVHPRGWTLSSTKDCFSISTFEGLNQVGEIGKVRKGGGIQGNLMERVRRLRLKLHRNAAPILSLILSMKGSHTGTWKRNNPEMGRGGDKCGKCERKDREKAEYSRSGGRG